MKTKTIMSKVVLNTTNVRDEKLLKFINEKEINMKFVGGFGDFEEYEYIGETQSLKTMISIFWGDEDLTQYIKEVA